MKVEQTFWLNKYIDSSGQEIINSLPKFPHVSVWTLPSRISNSYENPFIQVSSTKEALWSQKLPVGAESPGFSQMKCKCASNNRKTGLKLNIKKTKMIASSPITSWQIEGGKVVGVTDLLFFSSKITVDGDCSHEMRRRLLLGRKARTDLDSVLNGRHHSADKGPYSQGYGLPSSHVLWELDCKEAPRNWCLPTAGEDSWEPAGRQGDQISQS